MIVFTGYSKTHEGLFYEHFLPSIQEHWQEINMWADCWFQHCPTGTFYTAGWDQQTKLKTLLWQKANSEGQPWAWADVDIRFVGDVATALAADTTGGIAAPIWFQSDQITPCCGFFYVTDPVTMQPIFDELARWRPTWGDDQNAMWDVLREWNSRFGILSKRFWNPGYLGIHPATTEEGVRYMAEKIPADAVLVHANWIVTVQLKDLMLRLVKKRLR